MDYQPGLYEAASSGENPPFDGRCHPCLFFSPIYSQEEFLHGLLSSSCGMEDTYFSSSCYNEDEPVYETYEGEEQLPYYSCGNWLSDFEHSVGHCWGDGYFSLGNETQENEDGSDLRKVEEDSGRCDQQDESSYEHEVREEAYPASNTWSFDSWFACAGKANYHDYNDQESRNSFSYQMPEIAVFESIFGYWPCLYQC